MVKRSCKMVEMFGQNSLLQYGPLLVASFGYAQSIGVAVLHLPTQQTVGRCKITRYFIYIDRRIAILELFTQRHKLRSQFPYLLSKFGVVSREFVSKTLFYFCYNSFIKQVQLVTLNHLKNRYSQFTCSQFVHLILAGFIITNPIFSPRLFSQLTVSSKKAKIKTRQFLPHASYGPVFLPLPGRY